MRRHLWSNTRVGGEAFEYTGTAKEILLGFLMALAIVVPIQVAYFIVALKVEQAKAFASLPMFLIMYLFGHFAVFRARRYRASRTVFRGVRFWMTGSGLVYAAYALLWDFLTLLTCGLAYPWRAAALERYKMRRTRFGTLQGDFVGRGGALFVRLLPFLLAALAAGAYVGVTVWRAREPGLIPKLLPIPGIIVLPLLLPFFLSVQTRWRLDGMRFGAVRIESRLEEWGLLDPYFKFVLSVVALLLASSAVVLLGGQAVSRTGLGLIFASQIGMVLGVIWVLAILLGLGMLARFYLGRGVWAAIAGSLAVFNVAALDRAAAAGGAASSLGEGFADALDVGASDPMDSLPLGTFYDGRIAAPRPVHVRFEPGTLDIVGAEGPLASWPYADIRRSDPFGGTMRLRNVRGPELARLELSDATVQGEVEARCADLHAQERTRTEAIVLWSLPAAASLILTAIYLVPSAADRLAPFIPVSWERELGAAVDNQVRAVFGTKTCEDEPGKAALAKLSARLLDQPGAPAEASIAVLASSVPNAVALPGGRIYLFEGLLRRAESPDEVAGVLAHEIGHVAHRDGLRRLLQTGGTSFLLGLLFGDVTGSGAIILASRMILDGSYSRDAERGADAHAVSVMLGLGRSPEPLGALLQRISGRASAVPPFLSSHPVTEERMQALGRAKPAREGPPLLSEEEWRALKSICKAP